MGKIEPYTDIERKCIAHKCKHFICWQYWGRELHSCELSGESDTIEEPAKNPNCCIK